MSKKLSLSTGARNLTWTIHIGDDDTWSYEQIQVALLNDIRAELREIRERLAPLQCPSFLAIPQTLRRISRNTAKKRKPKVIGKPKLRVVR